MWLKPAGDQYRLADMEASLDFTPSDEEYLEIEGKKLSKILIFVAQRNDDSLVCCESLSGCSGESGYKAYLQQDVWS